MVWGRRSGIWVGLLLLAGGCGDGGSGGGAPTADAYGAETAARWVDLSAILVRDTAGFSPPVASRAFAYMGIALYEATVGGMPEHRSLAGLLPELERLPAPVPGSRYHWPSAANAAFAAVLRHLFPTTGPANLAAIDALEAELAAQFAPDAAPAVRERSAALGRDVARAVFEWSSGDGGYEGFLDNFPTDYEPPVGPGLWQATPPGFQRALQPYWGANRPFAVGSSAACAPPPPPPYSEDEASEFHRQALEVRDAVRDLTDEQRAIALFWSDDPGQTATPPGHSFSILTQVLRQRGATLDVAAEAYARLGIAVADAFISCWETKFVHNLLRPVTYIQAEIEPGWLPLLTTPPFPEYTSGHSVQSGAMARVLTDLFGIVAFTDHTHDARGLSPRSFPSFEAAADEAAISRLYGGIHYRAAIDNGLAEGDCVGAAASALPLRRR